MQPEVRLDRGTEAGSSTKAEAPWNVAGLESIFGWLNEVERQLAPDCVWYSGNAQLLRRERVSIVGSRRAPSESINLAARLAADLAKCGVVVVSGLARGIDTAAHLGAIEAKGHTIAVLGTGIRVSYPPENRKLQEAIGERYLLVTQFAPDTGPARSNFPQRNRFMALLSQATVLVDAEERSGTVSQAWETLRLGRRLLIAPPLLARKHRWVQEVLRYGAEPLMLDLSELVEDLKGRDRFVELAL